ncbi:MAG: bifunctional DNA-formamidopyrimidine glycosylase/DNA-(apurinic or apyrimidinic site) lyase [Bdellovibrionales bacterium]|nr:bifunctional DNA-formamidopyrimidine glycosylase/DNA-(apurinic or apyrimidinic site) lyase [Bdellovibrionales bacterium]
MPELPEVESTRQSLIESVCGKRVQGLTVTWPRMVEPHTPIRLAKALIGRKILNVDRRGKYLLLHLDDMHSSLVIHLRMSGRLRVYSESSSRSKHDHVVLEFENGEELRFTDPRKFGRLALFDLTRREALEQKLGPEPLARKFTAKKFHQLLVKRSGGIKRLLLDQSVVAGLGNIYTDEALWSAKIHPERPGTSLSQEESSILWAHIRRILKEAIVLNGTDFGDGVVSHGKFSPQVYGRSGASCPRCGNVLSKLVVAQRGTVVCNHCQR